MTTHVEDDQAARGAQWIGRRFPGEQAAIDQLVAIGAAWGYGNCITALEDTWAAAEVPEQAKYGITLDPAQWVLEHRIIAGDVARGQLRRYRTQQRKAAAKAARAEGSPRT